MIINTLSNVKFEIRTEDQVLAGSIIYSDIGFSEAALLLDEEFALRLISPGVWVTGYSATKQEKLIATIKAETGGVLSVRKLNRRRKYIFKKSTNWKSRFSLLNSSGEELLALIPAVNWKKESHDYILQLNEEFENECDSFLILQAVHCANCSLSMMTGGEVPALISV